MCLINNEIRNRIHVAVAAYAYEVMNISIMSDAEYDKLALSININEKTGNKILDDFFANNFDPSTGSWVYKHPDINGLVRIINIKLKHKRN